MIVKLVIYLLFFGSKAGYFARFFHVNFSRSVFVQSYSLLSVYNQLTPLFNVVILSFN